MNESATLIRERFSDLAEEIQILAFIPRNAELQRTCIATSEAFAKELAVAKQNAIDAQDESLANELLFMEFGLAAITSQLRMCTALKTGEAELAWDHLVDAQAACVSAITVQGQIEVGPPVEHLENLHQWLLDIEAVVFPPQAFMSVGGTASERRCSICDLSYDTCEHVRGRAYMGRVCYTIISEMRLAEVSIVSNPANKRARVTHFSDGGVSRNMMTWRVEQAPMKPPAT